MLRLFRSQTIWCLEKIETVFSVYIVLIVLRPRLRRFSSKLFTGSTRKRAKLLKRIIIYFSLSHLHIGSLQNVRIFLESLSSVISVLTPFWLFIFHFLVHPNLLWSPSPCIFIYSHVRYLCGNYVFFSAHYTPVPEQLYLITFQLLRNSCNK